MSRTLKTTVVGIAATLLMALGAAGSAEAAVRTQTMGAPSVAGRSINVRYCWMTTVFNPACPGGPMRLETNGTIQNRAGTSWTQTPTTLTLDFINPTTTISRTTYTGTLENGTTQVCFSGTMFSTRINQTPATVTGVWRGCLV